MENPCKHKKNKIYVEYYFGILLVNNNKNNTSNNNKNEIAISLSR